MSNLQSRRAKQNNLPVNLPAGAEHTYKTDWNLDRVAQAGLIEYFLRNWTAGELVDNLILTGDGPVVINIWGINYHVEYSGSQVTWSAIKQLAKDDMIWQHCNYWLSFRHGIADGKKFAYVIIQEDKK